MERQEQLLPESVMDDRIDALEKQVRAAILAGNGANWGAVWDEIRSMSALSNRVWFPSVQDRRASWDRFQAVVGQVQDQRNEAQKRWDAFATRKQESRRVAEEIMELARAAWPHEDGFMQFLATITGAAILAAVIVAMIELSVTVMTFGLLKPDRHEDPFGFLKGCSQSLHEAWALYHEHHELFPFEDRRAMRDVLLRVQAELQQEWDKLKSQRSRISDERVSAKRELIAQARSLQRHDPSTAGERSKALMTQWKEVGFVGDQAEEKELWATFRSALDQFWEERNAGRKERLQRTLEATRANVRKLQESVEHDQGVLEEKEEKLANVFDGRRAGEIREHLQEVIASLQEKIERKLGWIAEQEERIREMERILERV